MISQIIDNELRPLMPGCVAFENNLGGRVVVVPYDLHEYMPVWFLSWHRRRQLQAMARWLFRERVPMSVDGGAYPLALRTDYPNYTMACVINLSADAWPKATIELDEDRRFGRVEQLTRDGKWKRLRADQHARAGSMLSITIEGPLTCGDLAVVRAEAV